MNSITKQEELRTQLCQSQLELNQLKLQLKTTQVELARSQAIIAWMETSKFWKLRLSWINLRQTFKNLAHENHSAPVENQPVASSTQKTLVRQAIPRTIPRQPKVLLIVEDSLPQCFRYRVKQKIEQLQALEMQVDSVSWREHSIAYTLLHFYHIVIFYRVPASESAIEIIQYAKSINKIILFDVDDLIFDPVEYGKQISTFRRRLSEQRCMQLLQDATLYHDAMALFPFAIASTPALAEKMAEVVGNGNAFVHRNGLDSRNHRYLQSRLPKLRRDYISIFYGTGTDTHDADFEIVAPALVQLFHKYQNLRLTIVGPLKLPESLAAYCDRIDCIDRLLGIEQYFEFLSQADINIAPLQAGVFADCKSEIKWLEAAILKVPSVVSATQTYQEILKDGIDALLIHQLEDWFTQLDILIKDSLLRESIAEGAFLKAQQSYSVTVLANNLSSILNTAIQRSLEQGTILLESECSNKKKILVVNILYPPQALGGATVVVKNTIDALKSKFKSYELSVFTCDIVNSEPYKLTEYVHDDVHVTSLSVTHVDKADWYYQDPQVYTLFKQYLQFNQPDLIHFHCIQRLTASPLEAASELGIPYIVTLHDAWWLCDHQFLTTKDGVECDIRQNDPVIAAKFTLDIDESIARRRYLAKQLNQAKALLAVSEFQASLYRQNGFDQVQVNRNGILPRSALPRKTSASGKLRIGYAAGISIHKGFFFLKDAILEANLVNTELIVIDISMSDIFMAQGIIKQEMWDRTSVTYLAKLPPDQMPNFFSQIDVLIAPSLWPESFGLITREAAIAGVWVVAADKGGLAEDIIPGVNGDIFSPKTPDELIKILQRLDRNPGKYQQLVVSDTSHIRMLDEQVEELENIYEAILYPQDISG